MERRNGARGAAWAALLSPAAAVLPSLAARLGGGAGWLSPLVAFPVLLLLMRTWRSMENNGGVPRALTIIYIMWALLLGAARLRLSVRRLQFTAQRETNLWLFLFAVAVGAAWLAWGERSVFLRTAAVFGRVLTAALAGVLGLTLFEIRPEELLPLWTEDVVPVLKSAGSVLGVLCYGVYGAFLRDGTPRRETGRTLAGCGVLTLLLLSVLGNLGAELAGALEDPFLSLSRHVGVAGAFQRVESLISALWLLGDLALLGLLLQACRGLLNEGEGRWAAPVGAAVMVLLVGSVFHEAVQAQRFEYIVMPVGNLVLGGVVPCTLLLRRKDKGISCGRSVGKRKILGRFWMCEKNFKKSKKRC